MSDPPDFDLVAASLRADASDIDAFMDALAAKLELALPDRATIERRARGLLSKQKAVRRIRLALGDVEYALDAQRGVQATRRQVVRGIAIRSDELTLDEWIDALARDLATEAAASERSRLALERLLI